MPDVSETKRLVSLVFAAVEDGDLVSAQRHAAAACDREERRQVADEPPTDGAFYVFARHALVSIARLRTLRVQFEVLHEPPPREQLLLTPYFKERR